MRQGVEEEGALSGVQDISTLKPCHGKYGSAPLSGVTDPYSRSLYIGCFLPTNLQLMDERQKAFHLRDKPLEHWGGLLRHIDLTKVVNSLDKVNIQEKRLLWDASHRIRYYLGGVTKKIVS
jgi:hypothetical protein